MDFPGALERMGFVPGQDRPSKGVTTYTSTPNQFLTYYVHAFDDGTALFTWEFAITDFLSERGMQVGSGEALNLFMFPTEDDRGPQDGAWLVGVIDRAEAKLRSVELIDPEA